MAGEGLAKALPRYRKRYREADRRERSKVLDEFCELTGYHRKYAITLLNRPDEEGAVGGRRRRGPTYTPKAIRVLESIWKAADYPWSERLKAMLPLWLSPTQIRICSVSDDYIKHCEKLAKELEKSGVRVDIDDRAESVGKKISEAEKEWVPYVLVIGEKEAKSKQLPVRVRESGKVEDMFLDDLMKEIEKKTHGFPFKKLSLPKYLSKRPKFIGG